MEALLDVPASPFFFEDESLDVDDPPSLDPLSFDPPLEPLPPSPDPASAAAAFVRVPLELERSFLAHPEPLKCTVGGTNAFRSVSSAPQAGQNFGAGASIPWMNSVRVEQLEQT